MFPPDLIYNPVFPRRHQPKEAQAVTVGANSSAHGVLSI